MKVGIAGRRAGIYLSINTTNVLKDPYGIFLIQSNILLHLFGYYIREKWLTRDSLFPKLLSLLGKANNHIKIGI